MNKLEITFVNILIVVSTALITFLSIILITVLPYWALSEKKEYDKANTIMRYNNAIYYVITYEYEDDYIKAIDVDGHSIILPKEHTIIEEK